MTLSKSEIVRLWEQTKTVEEFARALESRVLAGRKPLTDAEYLALLHAAEPALQNFERAAGAITRPTPDDAKDAARYRWLRAQMGYHRLQELFGKGSYTYEMIDTRIDAAMQADKVTK